MESDEALRGLKKKKRRKESGGKDSIIQMKMLAFMNLYSLSQCRIHFCAEVNEKAEVRPWIASAKIGHFIHFRILRKLREYDLSFLRARKNHVIATGSHTTV